MPIPDWFDWTAGGASIAGLTVAWWASHQATGAKEAAIQARQGVFRRNSAEDLGRIQDLALDFSSAIQTERYELALHIAGGFIASCSSARERHRGFLGADGGKLEMAVEIVSAVSRKMQTTAQIDYQDLVADSQRVLRIVSGVTGILNRIVEEDER